MELLRTDLGWRVAATKSEALGERKLGDDDLLRYENMMSCTTMKTSEG